jgi:hypothetical protein
VFWDRERLDEMRILDLPWRKQWSPLMLRRDFGEMSRNWEWSRSNLKLSWRRRQLIFMAGGRGWWSEDDESKVQWPKGWSPWDDAEMKRNCPFCIGEVRCAPHRLVLRVAGKERVILPEGVE